MSRRLSNPDPDPAGAAPESRSKDSEPHPHRPGVSEPDEAPAARVSAELLPRSHVPALDAVLGKPFNVLDDGFVRVLDYMGDDGAVVQAARISYGAGTKHVHEDRGLIRYLMRHAHSTPFEMCEIKFHVRVPMDAWRQWVRHRTACLAAGTHVLYDLAPHAAAPAAYSLNIDDLYENKRKWIPAVRLRHMNEDTGRIGHTPIVDVYENGIKPVFRMTLSDGKAVECTPDHRFKFAGGWSALAAATGLRLCDGRAEWNGGRHDVYVNGRGGAQAGTMANLVRIARFDYAGRKPTYDVEVEGPHHNFIANGIVTHNSVNEYSTRYSVAIDATQQTPPDEWRLQSALNRQGSAGTLPREVGETLSADERALQDEARRVYEARLAAGVAREQARKDLPLSTYTEAYWKINLHNLLHFLNLRMDDHAQEEIRAYARVIGEEIVAKWVPFVWEAFLDYRRHALQLSGIEVELLRLIGRSDRAAAITAAERHGWLTRRKDGSLARHRERAEFEQKLAALGLHAPWA
jgi:flavin-dependent thymidylate synthase